MIDNNKGKIRVYIQKCRENVILPVYSRDWDSGMDVQAASDEIILPGETKIVWTGFKFAVPEGYEIQVRPRSGLSLNTPLRVSNSPGTIDCGYRGELGIIITNTSVKDISVVNSSDKEKCITIDTKGNRQGAYLIRKGDRIAQIVLAEVPRMQLLEIDDVSLIGKDRGGGFGSTGVI
jgi:dUTP pyrophosphatase